MGKRQTIIIISGVFIAVTALFLLLLFWEDNGRTGGGGQDPEERPAYTDQEKEWLAGYKGREFTLGLEVRLDSESFLEEMPQGASFLLDGLEGARGLAYGLLEKLEEELGIRFRVVPFANPQDFQEALRKKELDLYLGVDGAVAIEAGLQLLPTRFSHPYYCYVGTGQSRVESLYDFQGRTVGILEGEGALENHLRSYDLGKTGIRTYGDSGTLFQALRQGEVFAVVTGERWRETGENLRLAFEIPSLKVEMARIGVNPQTFLLGGILYKAFHQLEREGTLHRLQEEAESGFNLYLLHSGLTDAERAWLERNKTLYVSFSKESEPYNILEGNRYGGIVGEYLDMLGKSLGVRFLPDPLYGMGDWHSVTQRLESGAIHLLSAVAAPIRKEGEARFTAPYLYFNVLVIGREESQRIGSVHELEEQEILVVEGTPIQVFMETYYPYISLVPVADAKAMVESLKETGNRERYGLVNSYQGEALLEERSGKGLQTRGEILNFFYQQFQVSPRHAILAGILDKAIATHDIAPILDRYDEMEIRRDRNRERNVRILSWGGILLLLLLILGTTWLYLITERKRRYEEQNREQEYALQQYAQKEKGEEAASLAFFEWYPQEDAIDASPFFYQLIGLAVESDVYKGAMGYTMTQLLEMIPSRERSNTADLLAQIRMGLVDVVHTEMEIYNGALDRSLWFRMTLKAISHDPEGMCLKVVGMLQDISIIKEKENILINKEKMDSVERLAGGIGRDFNQMLETIETYTLMVQKKYPKDDKHSYWCGQILNTIRQGESLTQGLLDYSGSSPMVRELVDLNVCVNKAVEALQEGKGPKHKVLQVFWEDDLFTSVDRKQMVNVFTSLGRNALEAMPSGGTLTFYTGRAEMDLGGLQRLELKPLADGYICASVRDTGVGMTQSQLRDVFEPLYLQNGHQSRTGLGLATVKGIVQAHGGALDVCSTPGEGTTIAVYLPYKKQKENI
ncbi:ATP-binding protein [Anaerotalea alkaliphila]|uniref:histidine kinase n=1 Tax=Anaerotalea alkaliphila TaxID=2662126 RepID=A0A7X5HV53_9FIRM|nr:transporter substrate-binding domain-containing protein [Anaerotalea alkaliphila]NDL67227.1 transporter substrate-binding domain-containing protein [Anaerotalea alkaliphila]